MKTNLEKQKEAMDKLNRPPVTTQQIGNGTMHDFQAARIRELEAALELAESVVRECHTAMIGKVSPRSPVWNLADRVERAAIYRAREAVLAAQKDPP